MPNWVANKVHFEDKQVLKDCVSKDSKVKCFDFNKVIQMPRVLEIVQAPNRDSKTAKELTKKYGAPDWHEWAWKNWGTKWNASDTEIISDDKVEFKTAWATPVQVFAAISKKYKTTVTVEYADEDLGNNCGKFVIKNGKIVEEYVGDENYADYVWGWAGSYNEDALTKVTPTKI